MLQQPNLPLFKFYENDVIADDHLFLRVACEIFFILFNFTDLTISPFGSPTETDSNFGQANLLRFGDAAKFDWVGGKGIPSQTLERRDSIADIMPKYREQSSSPPY